jgi:hypothetical protein
MHQQPLPIPSLIAQIFMFQPAVLLLLFQALAIFLWPYVFPIFARLGSVLLKPAHCLHT